MRWPLCDRLVSTVPPSLNPNSRAKADLAQADRVARFGRPGCAQVEVSDVAHTHATMPGITTPATST
jgi:hypothetical protein